MTLKLLLVKDDMVISEIPLSLEQWRRKHLEDELESFEKEFDQFSKLFHALAHENRLRIMKRLFEDEYVTLGFADLMNDLDLNPKIVWESTRKLRESGLLVKSKNGKYRCPELGQAEFLMISIALRRLLHIMAQLEEF
jgi:DNA-binding transcriptional ArsR family regulator